MSRDSSAGAMFTAEPLDTDQLLRQSEILAMRQIADTMSAMRVTQEAIVKAVQQTRDKVDDVKDRVIRLEERNEQVERLRTEHTEVKSSLERACERINALESERDQRTGAKNLVEWLSKNAPWLVAVVVAAAAMAGVKLPH